MACVCACRALLALQQSTQRHLLSGMDPFQDYKVILKQGNSGITGDSGPLRLWIDAELFKASWRWRALIDTHDRLCERFLFVLHSCCFLCPIADLFLSHCSTLPPFVPSLPGSIVLSRPCLSHLSLIVLSCSVCVQCWAPGLLDGCSPRACVSVHVFPCLSSGVVSWSDRFLPRSVTTWCWTFKKQSTFYEWMWEKRRIFQLICLNVFICHHFLSCFVTLVLKNTEGKVTKLSSIRKRGLGAKRGNKTSFSSWKDCDIVIPER